MKELGVILVERQSKKIIRGQPPIKHRKETWKLNAILMFVVVGI